MSDEPKPLTEEELARVDDWVAECKEADLRHGVRMRRLLDELRRLRGQIHKLKEQLIAPEADPMRTRLSPPFGGLLDRTIEIGRDPEPAARRISIRLLPTAGSRRL